MCGGFVGGVLRGVRVVVQVKDFLNGSWDTVSQEHCNRVKSESETYRPDGLVERWAVMPWCLFSVYLAPKLFMTIRSRR